MLEAVNSVVSNAPLLKTATDSSRIDKGVSSAPDVKANTSSAPYISPYVYVSGGNAVLQIRDNNTGDVTKQFPHQSQIKYSDPAPAESSISNSASAEAIKSSQATQTASAAPVLITPPVQQTSAPVTPQIAADGYATSSSANSAAASGSEVSILT